MIATSVIRCVAMSLVSSLSPPEGRAEGEGLRGLRGGPGVGGSPL